MQKERNIIGGILSDPQRMLSLRFDIARLDFLFILLVVIAINLPYFSPYFLPRHDTLSAFQMYYFFYNEFFFNNNIAQWLPYGAYGNLVANPQLGTLTPVSYLLFCLGKIFAIKDVLFLFKLNTFIDQLIFLVGLYYLSRLFFKHTSTVIAVSLASFCSFVWFHQPFFNFKIYYLFPWVIYFLVLFVHNRRSFFFWLACLVCWAGTIGNCMYFILLWAVIFILVCAVIFHKEPGVYRAIWPGKSLSLVTACVFLAVLFYYFAKAPYDGTAILLRSADGVNTMESFLSYGGVSDFGLAVKYFTFGPPVYPPLGIGVDNTIYAGLLTAFFFLWALVFVRDKFLLALLLSFFFLLLFSFGGIFSMAAYYFPGMKYYRHIGLIYPLMKIILALCAGFGMEDLWRSGWKERLKKFFSVLLAYLFLVDLIPDCRSMFLDNLEKILKLDVGSGNMLFDFSVHYWLLMLGLFMAVRLLYSPGKKNVPAALGFGDKALAVFLVAFLSLDVFLFQSAVFSGAPRLSPQAQKDLAKVVKANKLDFMERRSSIPATERQKLAVSIANESLYGNSAQNTFGYYAFTQTDPCYPERRLVPLGLTINSFYLLGTLDPSDMKYSKIYACEEPKLRLFSKAVFLDNELEIRAALKSNLPDGFVYLKRRQPGDDRLAGQAEAFGDAGEVKPVDFTSDRLTAMANVIPSGGAWLTYADSYYPGWSAFVDGSPVEIYEADLGFKAVHLPAGRHTVKFVFTNGAIRWCSYLWAVAGLIFGIIFLLVVIAKVFFNFDLTGFIQSRT